MRKLLFFSIISVFCLTSLAFAQNPYQSLGVKTDVLTLSKGKYNEFFDNDTIVQIGSVLFNTNTNEVIGFIEIDTTYSESTLKLGITSRWLSPDPLTDEFPSHSPYNYVLNNPIRFTDPDGCAPDGGDGDSPFLIARLATTLFYDTKHSIENLVMNTFVPAGEGMKWQADYSRDGNGTPIFETVIQQVPSDGALRDAAGLALDAVNVAGAGEMNATSILSAKTGTNQAVSEGKELLGIGRSGKQARLAELANDTKVGSADRGWIKNEQRQIENGNRNSIRLPGNSRNSTGPGKVLAHPKGERAKDGFSYKNAKIQDTDLHKLEHKHEGYK